MCRSILGRHRRCNRHCDTQVAVCPFFWSIVRTPCTSLARLTFVEEVMSKPKFFDTRGYGERLLKMLHIRRRRGRQPSRDLGSAWRDDGIFLRRLRMRSPKPSAPAWRVECGSAKRRRRDDSSVVLQYPRTFGPASTYTFVKGPWPFRRCFLFIFVPGP